MLDSSKMRSNYLVFVTLIIGSLIIYFYLHFKSELNKLRTWNSKLEYDFRRLKFQVKNVPVSKLNQNPADDMAFDNSIIIYNRVPKTASTSFMGIAYSLCSRNKFNVLHINTSKNSHLLSLSDQRRFVENITTWDAKKPALYHGHLAYLDFNRFGARLQPLYINVIRKPLDRLISYYYFLRYGDDYRPHLKRRRKGNTDTFDQCVRKGGRDCDPNSMWMQIPFFCGHNARCWEPGNKWALEQAKHNLIHKYLLVGIMEELQDFVTMLEYTLPEYFSGAIEQYMMGGKSHLRKTSNKSDPSIKTVEKIQATNIWKLENEFYEFAADHFQMLKMQMLKVQGNTLVDKGQMFRFEKIRPR